MMRSSTQWTILVSLLMSAPGARIEAQNNAQSGAASAEPRAGRLITSSDIKSWNSIRENVLSNDGKWFAYVVGPAEGDATVVVRGTAANAAETRISVGDGGGSVAISGDSKWLGFLVAPPRPANATGRGRGGAGRAGGGGGQGGPATEASAERNANKLVILNLASGERKEFERIRRFSFNAEAATWVAMQGYPAGGTGTPEPAQGARGGRRGGAAPEAGAATGGAADLLLYNLSSGELFNMGRVGQYAFNDAGDWLAYTMDTPDRVGNGVQLRNMKTSVVRSIESDRLIYRHLAWVDSSAALSVMRGRPDTLTRDTVFSIQAFTAFGPNGPARKLVFNPEGRSDFPAGWKLASERAPRYAKGLTAVFFGIREANKPQDRTLARGNPLVQPGAPGAGGTVNQPRGGGAGSAGADTADVSSLILWHAKDPRLQSQQIVQEQQDRSFNYLAQYRFATDRFVRLADEELRDITITTGDRHAYGIDIREYQQAASYSGRNFQDVYSVDLESGARKLLLKKRPAIGGMSSSPDGRKVLFWGTDGHYWTLDLVTGDTVNITKDVEATFVDTEDDHNNLYPPSTPARGWTKDGSAVLLYDNWDVWKVPVKPGSARAVNLTGDGRKNQVRYQRLYQFGVEGGGGGGRGGGPGGRAGGPGQPIDMSKPLYFGTYGEWTKKEGLARVDPGKAGATSLFFEDARFNVSKAKNADVYIYTRQTFTEYPNYWVFNPGFKGGYPITDVNPQMKELAWSSGTRLIDYTSEKGDKLQGALYLPANYEPGKKYPLLVTIYEKRSQNKNGFVSPSETRAPDPALFTNRGFAVLDPDIVYRVNDPGMSAVWCVIPAVKAAIATGIVDSANIGLWGHSWGGYQTAFLVTQTNIFKAAIAGAPLTDMVSMYSSVYWNTGGTNQAIFESSQGRFKGNFIDNYDAYIRNSPAFHAKNVTTPLIILHNDKDGAVDFNQGITYFNTLRQLGKEVILLEYVGENHGLSRPVNQRDYATRMTEWFDHHLAGKPAADWIKNGVPRLRMNEHLLERRDSTRRVTS
jgi:dipeptidyl aminopeptidase/acylaminoacyl peptidase